MLAHVIAITLKANDSALSDCDSPSTSHHSPPFIFPSFIHLRPLSLVSPPLPSPLSQRITSSPLSLCPPRPRPPFSTSHSFLPLLFLHLFLSLSLLLPPSHQARNTTHFDSWGKQTSHVGAHKAELRQGNEVQKNKHQIHIFFFFFFFFCVKEHCSRCEVLLEFQLLPCCPPSFEESRIHSL